MKTTLSSIMATDEERAEARQRFTIGLIVFTVVMTYFLFGQGTKKRSR